MRAGVKNITANIITIIMVVLVGLFIANQAIFLHVHKLNDGSVVYHAHPYDKAGDSKPVKSHHHSNAEFTFFQNLETLFPIVFLLLTLITIVSNRKYSAQQLLAHSLVSIKLYKGRAPPAE